MPPRDVLLTFVQHGLTTNRAAMDWMQRYYPDLRIHAVNFPGDPCPIRIDATFVPLRLSLVINNSVRPLPEEQRAIFEANDWRIVEAVRPAHTEPPELCYSSFWLSMNCLVLDPKTVIVEAFKKYQMEQMDKLGMNVIPCDLRDACPFGALFWGNMGDKRGCKWTLSVTILIVSGATFLIGCLPGYETIGIGAVVMLLLLRMTQGFSVSGEYVGASTFIAEYAPAKHRGFYVSMVPASTATGLLAATVFATVMFTTFGADRAFVHDWGWHIPFLLALPLGYITHWIRAHLSDSPVCEATMDAAEHGGEKAEKQPVCDLFRHHLRPTLIAFGTCVLKAVGFYAVFTFMPACLTDVLECDAGQATLITNILLAAYTCSSSRAGASPIRWAARR